MTLSPYVVGLVTTLCLTIGYGCVRNTKSIRAEANSEQPVFQTLKNGQTVTLVGVITKVGSASGKSMAAWNGFDVGEMVYRFEPSQPLPDTARSMRLHVPERLVIFSYLNRVVRLTVEVYVPEPVDYEPAQPMQVPVSSSGAAIERETTLTAVDVAEVESK